MTPVTPPQASPIRCSSRRDRISLLTEGLLLEHNAVAEKVVEENKQSDIPKNKGLNATISQDSHENKTRKD